MTNTIDWNENGIKNNFFIAMSLFFISILLHQSNVIFGVNLSFADLFCMIILLLLIFNKQLLIPITPLLFFLVVSILVLVTAAFYIPVKFMHDPLPVRVISDYIKLLAIFSYFIIGYNLPNTFLLKETLKWYSVCGLLIGILGVSLTFLNISFLTDILFFAGTRFRGFMIDPNYFSVLQITALVYLTRMKKISLRYKFLSSVIILLAVLTSGSKTGIITFLCYFMLRLFEYLFLTKKKLNVLVSQVFFVIVLALLAPIALQLSQVLLESIASSIPSFGRIYFLLTDFNSAISESGSGREATWKAAFQVIQLSPLIGIGIGTYTSLALEMFNYNNVAHNTFLQLSAEWGIPLTLFFFLYVFFMIGKATQSNLHHSETNLILRDIIIILLIGSLAISLNNARVLWLFLGALVFSLKKNKVSNDFQEKCP